MAELRNKKPKGPAKRDLPAPGLQAPQTDNQSLELWIGHQVRKYRKDAGLTVAELAASAGMSPGMLSKIENGQISPSLSSLQTLAVALNLPIATLFASYGQHRDCSYVKAGDGVTIHRRGSRAGHQYQLLGHALEGDVVIEPYLITLAKDALPCKSCQHEGVEFVYLLSGEIEYAHDHRSYHLKTGDALLFDGGAIHGPEKLIRSPAAYLSIITYSRR